MSEEDDILDLHNRPKSGWNVYLIYGSALALFFYWFISGYFFWPLGSAALLVGMLLLLFAALVRLRRSEDRPLTSYAYFAGRIILIVGVYLHIQGYPKAEYLLWISFAFFGLGLAGLYFRKKT